MSICPYVRPSVCYKSDVYTQLNLGSHKKRHTIAQGLLFSDAKNLGEIPTRSSLKRAPNRSVVGSNRRFSSRPISRYILETVQDRDIVTMEG